MSYLKEDLVNEGWTSMEKLLNEEMPVKKKENNHNNKLIALFVLCAFSLGIFAGSHLKQKGSTAEVIQLQTPKLEKNSKEISYNTSPTRPVQNLQEFVQYNDKQVIQESKATEIEKVYQENDVVKSNVLGANQKNQIAEIYQAPMQETFVNSGGRANEILATNPVVTEEDEKQSSFLSLAPLRNFVSKTFAAVTGPKVTDKVKEKSNWNVGIGMNTGVNMDRNTKVVSVNSDWMYKLGKQNAIGLQLLYSAEDDLIFNTEEPTVTKETRPNPRGGQSAGRNPVTVTNPDSRQLRLATGLIIQQEIGYRFYSNFAFGVDMLQNSYTQQAELRSPNNTEEVRYHIGGYSSVALGYRLSTLVDLELSGTKSLFMKETDYVPGNSNQIVGGVKINF